MPTTFAVNENNDLYIGPDGNLAIITGLLAVTQACTQAARALQGEMIFSANEGIPYFQNVFNGAPNLIQFEAALRKAWREIDGVLEVVSIRSQIQNNVLSYTAVIQTIYGQGVVNGGF